MRSPRDARGSDSRAAAARRRQTGSPAWISWAGGIVLLACVHCAAGAAGPDEPEGTRPPLDELKRAACPPVHEAGDAILDKAHSAVYSTICGSSVWFDRFFTSGDVYDYDTTDHTYGRLSAGAWWDRRDGFDPALRLRARIPLPSFKRKLRLMIGRGTERESVEQRNGWDRPPIPEAFREVDDPVWMLGLGYGQDTDLEQGWELDAGVRIRAHPDAIGRAVYRRDWAARDDTIARLRQTFFWRASRGFGSTTQGDIDHLLNSRFMLRWSNTGTVAEDVQGLEWLTALSLYQDLPQRSWLAYTVLARGQTASRVGLQDYGLQVRWRRPVLREWLFLELSSSATFPRYFPAEERRLNPGVGARLEMFFGPAPREYVR
jgi:hypothetical protein